MSGSSSGLSPAFLASFVTSSVTALCVAKVALLEVSSDGSSSSGYPERVSYSSLVFYRVGSTDPLCVFFSVSRVFVLCRTSRVGWWCGVFPVVKGLRLGRATA